MHELSIAHEICRLAEQRLGPHGADQLVAIGLEVGDDAGVDPESLRFCLAVLLASPPFRNASPELMRGPGDALRLAYLKVDDGRPSTAGAGPGWELERAP